MKKKKGSWLTRTTKFIYLKIFRINDTPQKISLGLGLGVFSGIFPGTGPIAALFLALVLKVNRASALLGALLTNTWLSLVTFLLSIKIGSAIMNLKWQDVYMQTTQLFKNFRFSDLLKLSFLKVVLPVTLGYLIVSLALGILTYLATLPIIIRIKNARKNRINVSG